MRPIAVVGGYLIRYPVGGHTLSILHWLVGLRRLGYDVVFVEHHGWPNACFNLRDRQMKDDPSYGISVVTQLLARFDIDKWCYIDADGRYRGLGKDQLKALCRNSELMLGLWSPTWVDEFLECPLRIFIDPDPGFTQFHMAKVRSSAGYASPHDFHYHFSYGTRIGRPDCPIPSHGLNWRPLRPPVVLDLMPVRPVASGACFTTVMKWGARKPIVYEGEEYGQKDVEFWRIADLPQRAGQIFEIAVGGEAPREKIAAAGWRIADPLAVAATIEDYRDYISGSLGEFSVAVNLVVKSRSGWFSDRTAAYLASGRPAIVQDTGFSESLPCGEGLFAFTGLEDAVEAVETVMSDHAFHCAAARRLAEEHLDSDLIIGAVLRQSGVAP
jgi:hypothetical protein